MSSMCMCMRVEHGVAGQRRASVLADATRPPFVQRRVARGETVVLERAACGSAALE
jgi:hypothetical protein